MSAKLSNDTQIVHARQVIGRRWWVLILVAAIGALAGYGFASRKPKEYTASSALLFQTSQLDQSFFGTPVSSASPDPSRQAATNQALVELPTVARIVANQLHIPQSRITSDLTFGSDSQADVLDINVTDRSPAMAATIANAYVRQYIVFRQTSDQAQLTVAERTVQAQLTAIPPSQRNTSLAQGLQSRAYELKLLAALQTGNAEVVQTAVPPVSPSSPDPPGSAVVGGIIGLLLALVLVYTRERFDRRIKSVEEVEEVYGVTLLGVVPNSPYFDARGSAGTPQEQDRFRMLRAQLRYFDVDQKLRRLLITSADAGEGKSTISLNLARAAAGTDNKRSLLIETDMRRPSLAGMIGLESLAGLSELLSQSTDLRSGLRELVVTPQASDELGGGSNFDVLVAGAVAPNPLELIESNRMSELLEIADSLYDMVIFDTPPVGVVGDAMALIHQVDGVVVVSRQGVSRRDRGRRLMMQLRGLNANVLGVVFNGMRGSEATYGTYYGYGDGTGAQPQPRTPRKMRVPTGKGR